MRTFQAQHCDWTHSSWIMAVFHRHLFFLALNKQTGDRPIQFRHHRSRGTCQSLTNFGRSFKSFLNLASSFLCGRFPFRISFFISISRLDYDGTNSERKGVDSRSTRTNESKFKLKNQQKCTFLAFLFVCHKSPFKWLLIYGLHPTSVCGLSGGTI